jgi:fluoride exporter
MTQIFSLVNFVAIGLGAMLGAWSRWGLSLWLNRGSDQFPTGTFVGNMLGGYIIGVAIAVVAAHPEWPPSVRLFLITGFLGALTTFSSFSAETFTFFEEGRIGLAVFYVIVSLVSSIALTGLGMLTVHFFKS